MIWDVTIATHDGAPDGTPDDISLADAIQETGATCRFAVWSDPDVDWAASAVTIVRSTWDYHLRPARWRGWIYRLDGITRLVNAPELLRWNTDKSYLLDLSRRGIGVVPTLFVADAGEADAAFASLAARGWDDVVVKPSISASAHGAARFRGRALPSARAHALALLRHSAVLVQPFQRGVLDDRERSLVLLGGRFSHAFSKAAFDAGAAGGQSAVACHESTAGERMLADRVLASLPVRPAYARVDLVPTTAGPLLMELELIEPHLALDTKAGSAAALARAALDLDS
ncbi:ATP-grasp domain-containing protein [Allosphingosinicella deserti]|uniref:ATP-grasp domain-containing protein n=1 Tax=Allosphingosinicella deserti TaxID=2116704 RepID=A0A2P7QNR4_9SPHN|nr:hypothetical protein [Sphingomonas deserti]PSJ39607.1 hypothetical protein C7I55_13480 [Sphingomonas deserti]